MKIVYTKSKSGWEASAYLPDRTITIEGFSYFRSLRRALLNQIGAKVDDKGFLSEGHIVEYFEGVL